MIIHETLEHLPPLPKPIALTIGTFDGVHLGHQCLLQELKKQGTPVVLTFSNHPLTILNPSQAPPPILTLPEKLALLKSFGIAMTLVLPFTQELAQTPYDHFLQNLHSALPFSSLVLGENARLGAHAAGDASKIETLSKTLGFKAIFLPKLIIAGEAVSSRHIRTLLQSHKITQAEKLLGHPHFNSRINS